MTTSTAGAASQRWLWLRVAAPEAGRVKPRLRAPGPAHQGQSREERSRAGNQELRLRFTVGQPGAGQQEVAATLGRPRCHVGATGRAGRACGRAG